MTKLLFMMFFICSGLSVFAQQESIPSYPLKGVFKNKDSAVITGLRLDFTKNGQTNSVYTDINGEFETKLSPGLYQLTVNKIISEQFVAFVNIQENGLNPSFVEFVVPTSDACGTSSADSCPKPSRLVKPGYPPAARAVRAWGEVVVQVKINKDGTIASAKAINGHPLLRGISEQAALKSTFEPTETADEREVNLTYVFLLDADENKDIKRYSNRYRIQIFVGVPLVVDTVDY